MTITTTRWAFNGSYKDRGQIADLYPAYCVRAAELAASGTGLYDDEFRGCFGDVFATHKDESAAIYLCHIRRRDEAHRDLLEAFYSQGYRLLTRDDCPTPAATRFSSVVAVEPGSRPRVLDGARVIWLEDRWPFVLPKGNRSNGITVFMGSEAPYATPNVSFGSSAYGAAVLVK